MQYFDNFLSKDVLEETLEDITTTGFKDITYGDKTFHSYEPRASLKDLVYNKLSMVHGKQVSPIYAFARQATTTTDTNWNIHSDAHIFGVLPTHACVLCLSEKPKGLLNGTAFWRHDKYGTHFKDPLTEFDAQRADENDLTKFELEKLIAYKQNRAIIYDSNRYHSAYPNTAWDENLGRVVMAIFYTIC